MITEVEFAVLTSAAENNTGFSVEKISETDRFSEKDILSAQKKFHNDGLLTQNGITEKGLNALKPYEIKRAVLFAAGFGSRLVPVTLDTPKPLIKVNGKRIIDTILDACLKAGIEDIYIVRGYLGETFDRLLNKYPMIKFIDNPYYNEANNISSGFISRDLLRNTYIFESDLLITNPDIIKKYRYTSGVLGMYAEKTDDWSVTVDKDGFADKHIKGGTNCYKQAGIYYLNRSDGEKYAGHVEKVFSSSEGRQVYWEDVIHKYYISEYKLNIFEINEKDIIEIDTFDELKAIDKSYDV